MTLDIYLSWIYLKLSGKFQSTSLTFKFYVFYVSGRGTLMLVTAFGLSNAPTTQQRLVDLFFAPDFEPVFRFLDDVIVSSTFDEHVAF